MDVADIAREYRQIKAVEYEDKTGKPYTEKETLVDPEYEQWQKRIGIKS